MSEDFRYIWADGSMSAEFRAVSIDDAVSFVRVHYELSGPDAHIAQRLQCRLDEDWQAACLVFEVELVGASMIP